MKRTPPRISATFLVGLVLALLGSVFAQTTLTIARPADVTDLNPFRNANNATSEVTYQIHEGLTAFSPDVEIGRASCRERV